MSHAVVGLGTAGANPARCPPHGFLATADSEGSGMMTSEPPAIEFRIGGKGPVAGDATGREEAPPIRSTLV